MKRVKQFFLVITGVSLFFITGCTTMQHIPYDDVYYSTAKGAPQHLVAQNSNTNATEPSHYKVVKVETINASGQNTTSSVNQKQNNYQFDTLRVDTIDTNKPDSVTYSKINTGLGFENSNFGTGISSWSLGGYYGGMFGFNTYWNDPYWYNFYYPYSYPYYSWGWNPYYSWNYPYYGYGGFGLYSFGYPYSYWGYGFNYPYYGFYGSYGYPYYYSPYRYWHRSRYYGHRGSASLRGSSIPFSGSAVPSMRTKATRIEGKPSGIRPSVATKSTGTKVIARPQGSMRYQKALKDANATRAENTKATMIQKPPVYRSNNRATPPQRRSQRPVYRGSQVPVYRHPANMTTPRYQKPKQYRSLDTRQARSSTEYFRPQPQTVIHGKARRVNIRRTPQRFNIYRPSNTRSNYRRPVYRNSWIRTNRSAPVRHFNNTPQKFYSSPHLNKVNENNTRRYSPPPARIRTGGGGNRSGGSGGGNIRR